MRKVKERKVSQKAEFVLLHVLPRCKVCGQLLIATSDRSKPSELVEWLGKEWTKTKPQRMWMFPTKIKQSKYCSYCRSKLSPIKPGKES